MRFRLLFSFFIFIFIFLLLGVSYASAIQTKMAIKECVMSWNDPDYGSWNEGNHEGVFVKVINRNLNLGEAADYQYINNQRRETNPLNTLPILKVLSDKPNMLYTNCSHKVGDYRIYLRDYIFPYQGDGHGLHLTPDLGLNDGITVEGGFSTTTLVSDYNGVGGTYRDQRYNLNGMDTHGYPYYIDNGIHSGYDENATLIYRFKGLFPNTEPVIMTKINLTNFPSGILRGYSLVREAGSIGLFEPVWNYFYLNSSTRDIREFLSPQVVGGKITNLNRTNKQGVYSINVLECEENLNCFNLSSGGTFKVTYNVKNVYNVPLENIGVQQVISTVAARRGFGLPGTQVSYFERLAYPTDYFNVPAGSTVEYSNTVDIPLDNNFVWNGHYGFVTFYSPRGRSQANYFRLGDSTDTLLGFLNFDPRIELVDSGGRYNPFFNYTTTIIAAPTRYGAGYEIYPQEYNFSIEVWNGSLSEGVMKDSYSFSGQEVFSDLGISKLVEGQTAQYSFIIPILPKYIEESAAGNIEYYIRAYVVARDGMFKDLKISTPSNTPYFDAGDFVYPRDSTLYFGENEPVDFGRINLFNPSFKPITIKFDVDSWSDDEPFEISWDKGETYSKDSDYEVTLAPLSFNGNFSFYVKANYDPWVSDKIVEHLNLSVKTTLAGNERSVLLEYPLEVRPDLYLEILEPVCGDIIWMNDEKSVKVFSPFDGQLFIGEEKVYNLTKGVNEFSYIFTKPGNIRISATSVSASGKPLSTFSNVMVINKGVDGTYLAACIDKPKSLSEIPYGKDVEFDASSTRGVRYFLRDDSVVEIDKNEMNFYWRFVDGTGVVSTNSVIDGADPQSYEFWKIFVNGGDATAHLNVDFKS